MIKTDISEAFNPEALILQVWMSGSMMAERTGLNSASLSFLEKGELIFVIFFLH